VQQRGLWFGANQHGNCCHQTLDVAGALER
jgi:hypothetical protein